MKFNAHISYIYIYIAENNRTQTLTYTHKPTGARTCEDRSMGKLFVRKLQSNTVQGTKPSYKAQFRWFFFYSIFPLLERVCSLVFFFSGYIHCTLCPHNIAFAITMKTLGFHNQTSFLLRHYFCLEQFIDIIPIREFSVLSRSPEMWKNSIHIILVVQWTIFVGDKEK